MSMTTDPSSTSRPQRLVRTPTNPLASRPSSRAEVAEPAIATVGSNPIENIAVDLQGAPVWRLAVIALGVAIVTLVALLAAS